MDDRLKIASDMMAVLMTNPHWLDAEWPEYASAALDAADALIAEHERTRPHECPTDVGVTSTCPRCEGKPEPADDIYERGPSGDIIGLRVQVEPAPQADGDGLLDTHNYRNEYNSLIQLIAEQTYAVGIGETMTAEDRVRRVCARIRELEATVQRQADMLAAKPTPPAASPTGEIPGDVVRVIRDAYFLRNQRGNSCDAMRAALNEYDRQMPALRGRVLGERWQVRFADGEVSERTHWSKESADVAARASGGTVHRVALVEMGEVEK